MPQPLASGLSRTAKPQHKDKVLRPWAFDLFVAKDNIFFFFGLGRGLAHGKIAITGIPNCLNCVIFIVYTLFTNVVEARIIQRDGWISMA